MAEKTLIKRTSGGLVIWDAREEGKEVIGYSQDVSPTMEFAKSLANDSDYTRKGMNDGMVHYATIPEAVILKLWFEDGINVYSALEKSDERRLWNLLDTKYANFKTTTIRHNV